jgi:hypothetical protein
LFLEAQKDITNLKGYFSYTEKDLSKCVFFSKGDNPQVVGTIIFDSTYNLNTAKVDLTERPFTKLEKRLHAIREAAVEIASSDTLFKYYKNARFNFIPIIDGKEGKVYVLTGPNVSGVIIFGNDYLLTFDKNNKLQSKKQLHANIITMEYLNEEDGTPLDISTGMHSHVEATGDYITPTDICTLMLYAKFTTMKTYYIISKNYVSIWDCKKNELPLVMEKEAWYRMVKNINDSENEEDD